MVKGQKIYALPLGWFDAFYASLSNESDRGRIIVTASWIDLLIKIKLMNEFSKGTADVRKSLFSNNGPFATFSAKVNAAFCAGWIDNDVYHDIKVIKKLRNGFAHNAGKVSLDDEETRKLIESLRVPHRQFYDWGQLRAAATTDGVVIYTGEKPREAKEELYIPGAATFKEALPLVVTVLVANLGILFATNEKGTAAQITLPKHMIVGSEVHSTG